MTQRKNAMTFYDLGLIAPILSALDAQGYSRPSPIQKKAIPPALAGRDVLGCAQTGTGKTCAFAAPILQRLSAAPARGRPIRALILTPTRELAIQIGENFDAYGKNLPLRTTVIFGGVGQGPQVDKLKKGADILVATPGRLGDLYQQKLLDLSRVGILVLDEADRMLDMGFIHDVKKILKWLPEKKQTMLFSATMPDEITALVNSLLRSPVRVAVDPVSSPVEAIRQSVYFVDKNNKTKLLAHLVRERRVRNALVFTRTKHAANKVARDLMKEGISAAAIHGNKSQAARQQALTDFKSGKIQCLVATDIAARGLDIEELSHVFNYNLPEVPETYVHRIGRTGRAGHGGEAVAFCDFGEKPLLKDIETLIGRAVPVAEGHPFPMQVFEAPKRDKNGKIISPEDAEARAAARELRRPRGEARKPEAANSKAAPTGPVQPAGPIPSDEPPGKKRRSKGAKARPVETGGAPMEEKRTGPERPARQKQTRPGSQIDTGDAMPRTDFYRPDPLAGDHIMDATARLLAPRKPMSPVNSALNQKKPAEPASSPSKKRKKSEVKKQPEKKTTAVLEGLKPIRDPKRKAKPSAPLQSEKNAQAIAPKLPNKRRAQSVGRRRLPVRPVKPGQTKDSTEQKSLMKPFYLDF